MKLSKWQTTTKDPAYDLPSIKQEKRTAWHKSSYDHTSYTSSGLKVTRSEESKEIDFLGKVHNFIFFIANIKRKGKMHCGIKEGKRKKRKTKEKELIPLDTLKYYTSWHHQIHRCEKISMIWSSLICWAVVGMTRNFISTIITYTSVQSKCKTWLLFNTAFWPGWELPKCKHEVQVSEELRHFTVPSISAELYELMWIQ